MAAVPRLCARVTTALQARAAEQCGRRVTFHIHHVHLHTAHTPSTRS
jgi:hypothetical protein